jgi:hypothetical protein
MERLAQVAQCLREVREAHQRFLALYAVEVALVEPGIGRAAADVAGADDCDDDPDVPFWHAEDGGDSPHPLGWQ